MKTEFVKETIEKIYHMNGGYTDILKALASIESEDYKILSSHGDDPLDGDITESIAENLKQDFLAELNELEGNI